MSISVSIVIPAFNAEKTVYRTVEACLAQSYAAENIEIIVVDDGSTDRTKAVLAKYPVKYLYQPNGGPAKARNLGWRAASGGIVFFTDADCVPEQDWIAKLLPLFDSDKVGAAGGTYDICNPENITALSIHYEIQYRHSRLPEYVRYLGSFNLAVRKSALETVGGFDESFRVACGEDADLSYRLTDQGYLLRFCRKCGVGHYFPGSFVKFLIQQFWRGFWIMKLFFRHRGKVGKDDYGTVKDAIQPALFLFILLSMPLCFVRSEYVIVWLTLNVFGIFMHTPVVLFAVKRAASLKLLFLYALLYARGFFWATGSLAGLVRFVASKT